jgi:hypothetical protein
VTEVKARILLRMMKVESESAFFTADISWKAADPQALEVLFHAANGDTSWVFARDLIQRAYTFGSSGEGDVRIRKEQSWIILTLTSPDGEAEACTDAGELANFMAKTYAAVPSSMESAAYDAQVDRELAEFFGDS